MYNSFKAGVPDLDGVYFAKRNLSDDGFLGKVRKLIDKIVKRSEDIVNLRGFVLDNTSIFEAKTEEMIYRCYHKLQPEERNAIDDALKKNLNHLKNKNAEEIDSIVNKEAPIDEVKNNQDFHMPMWVMLIVLKTLVAELYQNYGLTEDICPKSINDYYQKQLGSYRNKLGHNTVEGSTIKVCGEEIIVNQDLHRRLRRNIVDLNNLYERLGRFIEKL